MMKILLQYGIYTSKAYSIPPLAQSGYPSCYRDTAQDALNEVALHFIIRHQKLWKMMQKRTATRISRWVNGNATNWHFAKWVTASYLTKKPFTVTYIANEMNITRTTARKLIADCLGEGWLKQVATNDKRVSSYICEQSFYKQWERYLSYIIKYSEFDDFFKSLKTYEFCIDKLERIKKGKAENMVNE